MDKMNFVRERVLTFSTMTMFLINLAKKTLQVSLNLFCSAVDLPSVTKQAFSKARKKLSPQTFILLNKKLISEFYTDNSYETWKGFRLVAIDGSDLQIPQTEELKKIYGTAKNQHGSTLGMAKISYAYDLLNKITLDCQIDCCKTSERSLALRHVEAFQQLEHDPVKDLYIFDRGYPSYGLLFYLSVQNKDFLFRCSQSSCFAKIKEALNQGKKDVIIRIYATDANDEQYKFIKEKIPSLDRKTAHIDIRAVMVRLSTGEEELLITSLLNQSEFLSEDLMVLYSLRWGIEENYKWHKSAFELENFSGQTQLAVEQELYCLVFVANMSSILIQEAQEEIEEENKNKNLKHTYKINRRIAVSALKDRLIVGILDPRVDMEALCNSLKIELKKNLCPVRPNRKYTREEKGRLKFGITMRKSI